MLKKLIRLSIILKKNNKWILCYILLVSTVTSIIPGPNSNVYACSFCESQRCNRNITYSNLACCAGLPAISLGGVIASMQSPTALFVGPPLIGVGFACMFYMGRHPLLNRPICGDDQREQVHPDQTGEQNIPIEAIATQPGHSNGLPVAQVTLAHQAPLATAYIVVPQGNEPEVNGPENAGTSAR